MKNVTVAVLTYNPDKEKLFATLRSVLLQKDISMEIVIADDGSARKCFDEVKAFFAEYDFSDYKIVENPQNRGTVYNTYSAVEAAQGDYVKLLSPGDMLSGEDVLSRWVNNVINDGAQLSFADAVYYVDTEDGPQLAIRAASPREIDCYVQKNTAKSRYQYLICADLFLGAATLCHRQTLEKYLKEICGKVVYAEDNIYRLMAYDKVNVYYFPETAVVYETGTGVSTSKNTVWEERLRNDWNGCSQLLLARCTGKDPIDKQLRFLLKYDAKNKLERIYRYMRLPGLLCWNLKNKGIGRQTANALPEAFLNRVMRNTKEK